MALWESGLHLGMQRHDCVRTATEAFEVELFGWNMGTATITSIPWRYESRTRRTRVRGSVGHRIWTNYQNPKPQRPCQAPDAKSQVLTPRVTKAQDPKPKAIRLI